MGIRVHLLFWNEKFPTAGQKEMWVEGQSYGAPALFYNLEVPFLVEDKHIITKFSAKLPHEVYVDFSYDGNIAPMGYARPEYFCRMFFDKRNLLKL